LSQAPNSRQTNRRSCLFVVLIIWAFVSLAFTGIVGALYFSGWFSRTNEDAAETSTPLIATPAEVVIGITVEVSPTSTETPTPTATPIPPIAPTPTDTATATPIATPSYQITSTTDIAVYLEPRLDTSPLTSVQREVAQALTIQARTTDGKWLQVCCFNLGVGVATRTLWVIANTVLVLRPEMLVSAAVQQVIPLTATPTGLPPTHFQIEAGPEYYATDNGLLSIFAKVFRGAGTAQDALPGYMLKVRYKATGQDEYLDRTATNVGSVSIGEYTLFKNGVHIYNLKYEFDPGTPPEGKTKADLLGAGDWEMWLTNAEGIELSRRIPFTTNPLNKNREIFISFGLVR